MAVSELEAARRPDGLYEIDGELLSRDYYAEHGRFKDTPGAWPQYSDAAGVAVHQIAEAREKSVRDGVPTEFTADGRAIFRDREHRARYLATIGMYDRDGGSIESKYHGRAYSADQESRD